MAKSIRPRWRVGLVEALGLIRPRWRVGLVSAIDGFTPTRGENAIALLPAA